MRSTSISFMLVLAGTAAAKTIVINAGKGGLTYSPSSSTASPGDVLEFHFFNSFHSVAQGDFGSPCQMSSAGFFSGLIPNKADGSGSVFQVTVKDTNPIWFFCGTPGHCQAGMVGVINAPPSGDSLATYTANAAGANTQTGGSVQGGVVVPVPSAVETSSNPPPAPSSSSAPVVESSSSSVAPTAPAPGKTSSSSSSPSVGTTAAASSSSAPASQYPSSQSESASPTSAPTTAAASASTSKSAAGSSSSSGAVSSAAPLTTNGGSVVAGSTFLMGFVIAGLGFFSTFA